MIEKPTVFILGAGASSPYRYPLGDNLRRQIIDNLRSRPKRQEIVDLGYTEEEVKEFADDLDNSVTYTIDEFIETRKKLINIGKVAIAQALIPSEVKDFLLNEDNSCWYRLLAYNLRTRTFDDFSNNQVKIITFNYDRSLEEFLYQTQNARHRENFDVKELIKFPILHVFGKLGDLDWQKRDGRAYDHRLRNGEYLKYSAEGIRTLHERDKAVLREIKDYIDWANDIYFLGFGYDKTNLQNMYISNMIKNKNQRIIGTAFDVSSRQREDIKECFKNRIFLGDPNEDCTLLLKRFGF